MITITNLTQPGNVAKVLSFTGFKEYAYPVNLYISGDGTNCKLSYIHGIAALYGRSLTYEEQLECLEGCLKEAKGMVIINTIYKEMRDFIHKACQVYYSFEVPIGYQNGLQYHIGIRNHIINNPNCKIPKPLKSTTAPEKDKIRDTLLRILKSKKRKADYVDEFINSL